MAMRRRFTKNIHPKIKYNANPEYVLEGAGAMSAVTQNYVYSFGKRKPEIKDEYVISSQRLKEIKEAAQKCRIEKKIELPEMELP